MPKSQRPTKRVVSPRKTRKSAIAFGLTSRARHVMALARKASGEERGTTNAVQGYHVRQRLDEQITALAERIASKPLALRDDLLTLALAGWYAPGARPALVKAILRAGGIDPKTL